jgi:hypothetical protein
MQRASNEPKTSNEASNEKLLSVTIAFASRPGQPRLHLHTHVDRRSLSHVGMRRASHEPSFRRSLTQVGTRRASGNSFIHKNKNSFMRKFIHTYKKNQSRTFVQALAHPSRHPARERVAIDSGDNPLLLVWIEIHTYR